MQNNFFFVFLIYRVEPQQGRAFGPILGSKPQIHDPTGQNHVSYPPGELVGIHTSIT